MSTDIERLLAAAADDSGQPLRLTADDGVRRARRTTRNRRIATAATAAFTGAVVVGGLVTWSGNLPNGVQPAGAATPTKTVMLDVETGKVIAPPPLVSSVSDRDVISRCRQKDIEYVQTVGRQPSDTTGGDLNSRWSVAIKTSDKFTFNAVLVSPDHRAAAFCHITSGPTASWGASRARLSRPAANGTVVRAGYVDGVQVPSNVTKVLVEIPGEAQVRQARLGADGFFTLGVSPDRMSVKPTPTMGKPMIRGYDAAGRKVLERQLPFTVQQLPPLPQR
jgi:hypothetical protein